MVNIESLKQENESIDELRRVLSVLIEHQDLHTNKVFCDLLEQFKDLVQSHLDHEDREIYSELLNHKDKQVNDIAAQFLNNTHELRRLFEGYIKCWCHVGGCSSSDNDSKFVRETQEIFHLIEMRISLENDRLFPALA